jgi:hypothetical protein
MACSCRREGEKKHQKVTAVNKKRSILSFNIARKSSSDFQSHVFSGFVMCICCACYCRVCFIISQLFIILPTCTRELAAIVTKFKLLSIPRKSNRVTEIIGFSIQFFQCWGREHPLQNIVGEVIHLSVGQFRKFGYSRGQKQSIV